MARLTEPQSTATGGAAPVSATDLAIAVVAVVICGLAGAAYGDTVFNGLALLWNDWMLPTFTKIYLLGVSLCG